MTQLEDWAKRWGIPHGAVVELQWLTVPELDASIVGRGAQAAGERESAASDRIRVAAPRHGAVLLRNNVGVAPPSPANPRPVRYGLANDSPNLNRVCKSSDLIGLTPSGRFLAVETKREGWRWRGTDREVGQRNFMDMVIRHGGVATFATCWEDVERVLR